MLRMQECVEGDGGVRTKGRGQVQGCESGKRSYLERLPSGGGTWIDSDPAL